MAQSPRNRLSAILRTPDKREPKNRDLSNNVVAVGDMIHGTGIDTWRKHEAEAGQDEKTFGVYVPAALKKVDPYHFQQDVDRFEYKKGLNKEYDSVKKELEAEKKNVIVVSGNDYRILANDPEEMARIAEHNKAAKARITELENKKSGIQDKRNQAYYEDITKDLHAYVAPTRGEAGKNAILSAYGLSKKDYDKLNGHARTAYSMMVDDDMRKKLDYLFGDTNS